MKKILLLLAVILLVSCEQQRPVTYKDGEEVVIIDSCEYFRCYTYYGHYVSAHKGNCKFCAERYRQELQRAVEQLKEK